MDNVFLKIIAGEIPAHKVYEDEHTLAFLDIHPHNKGHVLVVPKAPYRTALQMPEAAFGDLMIVVHKLATAVKDTVHADGINININNEAAAGQEIFHAHVHIVPRFNNDHVYKSPSHAAYEPGEIEQFAQRIRAHLS